jgi:hypothetical protein
MPTSKTSGDFSEAFRLALEAPIFKRGSNARRRTHVPVAARPYARGVSEHRLAGVIEKFNRGSAQFDELREEAERFFNADPTPYRSIGGFDCDEWEWVERFQVVEQPPLRLGVILGDVVHNLRSSLDHLMWQVTLLDGGTPNRSTQFPIASKSEEQFEAMADTQIPGLNEEHRAFVKKVQPYDAEPEAGRVHLVGALADLSNTDKHRVLNTASSFMATEDIAAMVEQFVQSLERGEPGPARGLFMAKEGQALKHGAPWLRVPWDRDEPPPRNVQFGGHFKLGVAFGEPGIRAEGIKSIGETVLKIIQRFQVDFPETVFTGE